MKPNFALKLSNDGVELLHRASGGWSPVGSVDFENDDVAQACADLVAKAESLEPGGLRTKLVLPDSEVRYTSIVAPGPTDEARRFQIEDEIERLTPYRIEELAYDWSVEDDYALVVIAARETLIEAETFADGYGFNPVAFVAQPEPGQFGGEPFFGETMVAPTLLPAGKHVQPDAEPIRILRNKPAKAAAPVAEVPKAEPKAEPTPEPKPAEAPKAEVAKPEAKPATPEAPKAEPKAEAPTSTPATAPAQPKVAIGSAAAATERRPSPRAIPNGIPGLGGVPVPAEPEGMGARVGSLVRRMGTRLRREQAEAAREEAAAVPQRPAAAGPLPDDIPPAPPGLKGAATFSPAKPSDTPPARPAGAGPSPVLSAKPVPTGDDTPAPAFSHRAPTAAKTEPGKASTTPAPRPAPGVAPKVETPKPVDAKADAPASEAKAADPKPEQEGAKSDVSKSDGAVAFSTRRRAPSEPAPRPAPTAATPAARPVPRPVIASTSDAPKAEANPGGRIAVLPGSKEETGPNRLMARARAAFAGAGASAAAGAATLKARRAEKAAAPVTPTEDATTAPLAAGGKNRRPAPPEAIVASSRPPATESEKNREAEALTIFGARGTQRSSGGMARRGLMAAGGALLLLVAVAIWAVYFSGGTDNTQLAANAPVEAPLEQGALAQIEAPSTLAEAGSSDSIVPPALSGPATPEDAGVVAGDETVGELAATEPEEPVTAPETTDPDQMLETLVQEALQEALPADALPDGGAPAEVAATETAPETAAPEVVEAPATETADAAAETALAQAEPDAGTAVEGEPQAGGAPEAVAATPASEAPDLASAATPEQRLSLPSQISVPSVSETAFVTPAPPPPYGTEFTFDDRGLVEATPDGALTPSGVTVYAGRPEVAPAPRPGTVLAPVAEPAPAPEETAPAETVEAAPEAVVAPEPSTEPVAAAIESAIAEAVGGDAAGAVAAPETPAVPDDTPRADPALAEFRPLPRPERISAIGEQLEAERAAQQPQEEPAPALPDEPTIDGDQAALTGGDDATLIAAASTAGAIAPANAAATRASDSTPVTELAALDGAALDETAVDGTTPGGLALSGFRPQRRPTDLVPEGAPAAATDTTEADSEPEIDLAGATPEAVAASPVPGERPGDIAERAREILASAASTAPAPAAPAATGSREPSIPTSASVAEQATDENAIRLRDVNLIGVFGSENDRRALVRLASGRVVRLRVGDRLEGGQVAAIGESELRYVVRGRNEVLRIGG
ncbi:hypothetical protein [Pararhodobacter sp. CCB-MM2]|uniref:hypothetical protein n=1 Tax=Pararhodobacter sp. CCB-MM2 TaxID=1786003 RepID=UPI00082EC230|nr:hypothetical protein [Pararhodobacter sp. CCB-MM2]